MVVTTLLIYQIIITLIVLGLFWVTLLNLLQFSRLPAKGYVDAQNAPMVSVLVPARNEERGIEACVRSLCEQQYPNFEVIVLDDGSTDRTHEILNKLILLHDNLTVIKGAELPDGWVGKPWACHQLSQKASGDVLIFTDADTTHKPLTISASQSFLQSHALDFFSIITRQELGSFAENVVIPMVHVLYFAYLPNALIIRDRRSSLSAANGQFMCFRREAYDAVGGHECVKGALVEDVFLAKTMKKAGKRIALVDGIDHVSCRMYTSAREVTHGFSKNFFPGTGYNVPVTVTFLVHLFTAFVAPVFFLIGGLFVLDTDPASMLDLPLALSLFSLPLTQLALAGIIRFLISLRFRMPVWHAFLQPVTAIWSIMIGINSMRWAYSRHGALWKGRTYKQAVP